MDVETTTLIEFDAMVADLYRSLHHADLKYFWANGLPSQETIKKLYSDLVRRYVRATARTVFLALLDDGQFQDEGQFVLTRHTPWVKADLEPGTYLDAQLNGLNHLWRPSPKKLHDLIAHNQTLYPREDLQHCAANFVCFIMHVELNTGGAFALDPQGLLPAGHWASWLQDDKIVNPRDFPPLPTSLLRLTAEFLTVFEKPAPPISVSQAKASLLFWNWTDALRVRGRKVKKNYAERLFSFNPLLEELGELCDFNEELMHRIDIDFDVAELIHPYSLLAASKRLAPPAAEEPEIAPSSPKRPRTEVSLSSSSSQSPEVPSPAVVASQEEETL